MRLVRASELTDSLILLQSKNFYYFLWMIAWIERSEQGVQRWQVARLDIFGSSHSASTCLTFQFCFLTMNVNEFEGLGVRWRSEGMSASSSSSKHFAFALLKIFTQLKAPVLPVFCLNHVCLCDLLLKWTKNVNHLEAVPKRPLFCTFHLATTDK